MDIQTYTVEEFQENWNTMIARVERGEHIGITDGNNTAVMIPADDELLRIYTDHEEGS
jgi:antitoxin (DNA-binding transcriptional repressor) of toxin-antitoxin stability system